MTNILENKHLPKNKEEKDFRAWNLGLFIGCMKWNSGFYLLWFVCQNVSLVAPRTVCRTGDMCICSGWWSPWHQWGSGLSCEPVGPRASALPQLCAAEMLRCHFWGRGWCWNRLAGCEYWPVCLPSPGPLHGTADPVVIPPALRWDRLCRQHLWGVPGLGGHWGSMPCCRPLFASGRRSQKPGSVLACDQAAPGFVGPSTADVPFCSLTRAVSSRFLCCEAPLFPSVINKYFRG